jgi:peptide/nickel transport system permease protein
VADTEAGAAMGRYVARRLLQFVPTLLGASIFLFVMLRLLPADFIDAYFLDTPRTPESVARLEQEHGLNKPPYEQYLIWLGRVLRGDLGTSFRFGKPISDMVIERLSLSLEITIIAILLTLLIGLAGGIVSAVWQNSIIDNLVRLLTLLFISAPVFWVGTMVILVLSRSFGWIPPLLYVSFREDPLTNLQIIIIPAAILGIVGSANIVRLSRGALLEVLRNDYVRTARAKGLSERAVLGRHALKNALIPITTIIGLNVAFTLAGSVVLEIVFNLPGLGRLWVDAIYARDYPVVQSVSFVIVVIFMVANLITDLTYGYLDPRIRFD